MSQTEQDQPIAAIGYADAFKTMAGRIERNAEAFGGAFVLIGPDGKMVECLTISDNPNKAAFWSTLKGMVDLAINEVAQEERPAGYGGRR